MLTSNEQVRTYSHIFPRGLEDRRNEALRMGGYAIRAVGRGNTESAGLAARIAVRNAETFLLFAPAADWTLAEVSR